MRVVISHDRWFLDRICTHILAFEGNSEVFYFEGSYSEYEENKKMRLGNVEPKRLGTGSFNQSVICIVDERGELTTCHLVSL